MRACDLQESSQFNAPTPPYTPGRHNTLLTKQHQLTRVVLLVYSYGTLIKQHPLQGYLLNPLESQGGVRTASTTTARPHPVRVVDPPTHSGTAPVGPAIAVLYYCS